MNFSKSRNSLVFSISMIVIITALFTLSLVFLGSNIADYLFAVIFLGVIFVVYVVFNIYGIIMYLIAPANILSYDDDNLYIHNSRSRTTSISFDDVIGVGRVRRILLINLKDNKTKFVFNLSKVKDVVAVLNEELNAKTEKRLNQIIAKINTHETPDL